MKPLPSLSICIPAYNEEGSIREVLSELLEEGERYSERVEVLVNNDGSTDRTREILLHMAGEEPRIRLFENERNLGIEPSIKLILREVRGDAVLLTGADGEFPAKRLGDMVSILQEGYHMVVARRKGGERPLSRRAISFVYNTLLKILSGVETADAGGTKLIRREVLERIEVKSKGTFAEAERMIRAVRCGMKIGFLPVPPLKRRSGHGKGVRPGQILFALRDGFLFFTERGVTSNERF